MSEEESTKIDRRANTELRNTLKNSQKEAVASSVMTATGDNFFNAFAVFLQASPLQLSSLTAIPQLIGASMQLASLWMAHFFVRKHLVVLVSAAQAAVMLLLAAIAAAAWLGFPAVHWLIACAALYHAGINIIQPHWRAWMGSLVPAKRRGVFFAARSRLTMATTLLVFFLGGSVLTIAEDFHQTWLGFFLLFSAASAGRFVGSLYFKKMHDPDPHPHTLEPEIFWNTLSRCGEALRDREFRQYSFFVAGMQGMVAISAPFFAVYMLSELHFSYLQYSLNSIASFTIQFITLNLWGRVADRFGNRVVMTVTALIIPPLPVLWLFSHDFYYLILVQMISGFGWSGFSLSTQNYLYDIRPHRSNFATYAAMQSAIQAVLVFCGALAGGWVAVHAQSIEKALHVNLTTPIFVVFICSSMLRAAVSLWFLPRIHEPSARSHPSMLKVIYRLARFSSISGAVFDWVTVVKKRNR